MPLDRVKHPYAASLLVPNLVVESASGAFNRITGLSATTPAPLGTAAVGTSTTVARADHVHSSTLTSALSLPRINFTGGTSTISALALSDGTLSFESTLGQLFSITNSLTGVIFSVNDISGLPAIEVTDTGLTRFNETYGQAVFGGTSALTNAQISAIARTTTTIPLIVKGATSQTGNLQEWQSSAATLVTIGSGGQISSTVGGSTTTNGGQIYLNGATSNRIDFNQNGIAAPAFTTRSAGTKIALFQTIDGTNVDYALGMESFHMWLSVPQGNGSYGFKFYGGTTNIATLLGTGALTLSSTISATGLAGSLLTSTVGTNLAASASAGTATVPARADHVHPTTGLGLTSGTLAQFAATTSSQLAGVISDETGSGALVFGTAPTINNLTLTGTLTANAGVGAVGQYLESTGTGVRWTTVSGYSAPTIGSTSIGSGATVTTIAGLTLTSPTLNTPTLTLATASSTTDARMSWDTTNKKLQVGNGTIAVDFVSSNLVIGTPTFTTNAYTAALTDKDKWLELSNGATAGTFFINTDANVNFPIGTQLNVLQTGTGQITIAATTPGTTTINGTPGLKLRTQWSSATLIKRAANLWVVVGDLVA